MNETKQITIRLPADVYAAAVAAAEADRRKLATWIALAIEAVVLDAAAKRD